MFRICKAEFKKLFLKPSIFVVTAVLILALALCSFYKPVDKLSAYSSLPKVSPTASVESYYEESSVQQLLTTSNYNVLRAMKLREEYLNPIDLKQEMKDKVDELANYYASLKEAQNNYKLAVNEGKPIERQNELKAIVDDRKASLKTLFEAFKTYYENNVKNSSDSIKVLVKDDLIYEIDAFLNSCILIFNIQQGDDINQKVIDELNNKNFKNIINGYIDEFIAFTTDRDYVDSLNTYIEIAKERLGIEISASYEITYKIVDGNYTGLYGEIVDYAEIYGVNKDKDSIKAFQTLLVKYVETGNSCIKIITQAVKYDGLKQYNSQLNTFHGFTKNNLYQMQEEMTKLTFMFDNNSFSIDYGTPFSISQTSGTTINAFDFSYYSMVICMFIIVVYVISVAATTITGELTSGTIRMLAIRPYSRKKLIGGKLLATILIGVLLIVLSAITTLIMGCVLYGIQATPILVIFNASSAVVMHPVLLYLINIACLIFEMLFFILLALTISLLFKSQVASVAVSILLYFGSLVVNTFASTFAWIRFLPFGNLYLFKYFGSAFLSTAGSVSPLQSFISSISSLSIIPGSDFIYSIIYYGVICIGLTITIFEVFKRRDIK